MARLVIEGKNLQVLQHQSKGELELEIKNPTSFQHQKEKSISINLTKYVHL
jgi:hypothetical protein